MPKHSKAKVYRYESEEEDEDLEGGFLGALLSGAVRLGTTAARLAPRVATTAARSTAIVPYNAAAAAARTSAAATRAATTAARTSRLATIGRNVGRFANVAGTAAAIGLPIYQGLDYEQQKAIMAEEAQRIAAENANAQSEAYFTAQDKETQRYLAGIEEQRSAYEKEARELEAMRLREQDDYARYIEAQNERFAREEQDYQRALADQQRFMQEQIRAEVQRLSQMYTAPRPATTTTAPVRPATTTTAPVRQPTTTPAPAPAPVATTTAPQRLKKRGSGKAPATDKRKIRAEIVKRVMKEKGFKKLADASKYVKEHNLYSA